MITDKFTHIHVPKTAGTSFRGFIVELDRNNRLKILGEFGERSIRAIQFMNTPTIAHVRNPWAFYVSRYFWFKHRRFVEESRDPSAQYCTNHDFGIYNADSESACVSFEEHMRLGFDLDDNDKTQEEWIDNAWPVVPPFTFSKLFESMTEQCEKKTTHIGRVEIMGHDTIRILNECGVDCTKLNFPTVRMKRTKHQHYSQYYDDKLRDEVAERDAALIERFGYRFETE